MELRLEPGQTIKFVVDSGTVEFVPTAFGQHCFIANTAEEIQKQLHLIAQSTELHAFNASYETMTLRLKV